MKLISIPVRYDYYSPGKESNILINPDHIVHIIDTSYLQDAGPELFESYWDETKKDTKYRRSDKTPTIKINQSELMLKGCTWTVPLSMEALRLLING